MEREPAAARPAELANSRAQGILFPVGNKIPCAQRIRGLSGPLAAAAGSVFAFQAKTEPASP